jgi:hypothetical protein
MRVTRHFMDLRGRCLACASLGVLALSGCGSNPGSAQPSAVDTAMATDISTTLDGATESDAAEDVGTADSDDVAATSEWPILPAGTDPACPSNSKWTKKTSGSKLMEPGMACITCHDKQQGPQFFAAGTVYRNLVAVDTCNGSKAITVELTGADGKVYTATTNSAGNFYFYQDVATPYTARVISGSLSREMVTKQTVGDCNSCHTAMGENKAPGRIVEPSP